MSSSRKTCYRVAANFVLKNPDYILVHGSVTNFDLNETPYAWARKGNKIYDAEHDKWFTLAEWEMSAVEESQYTYDQVVKLVELTTHAGPWTIEERKRIK